MKKIFKTLSLAVVLAVAITAFAGCDFINGLFGGEDTTATVTWYNGTEVLKTEEIAKGGTVKNWVPDAPAGYKFHAWYKDSALTKTFNFNDVINEDTSIYAAFVSADFVADTTQYYLIGDGVGDLASSLWDHNNSMYDFALVNQNVPGANVFSITISMYAGDRFQICHDGLWDGQVGIGHMEGAELNEAGDYATVKDAYGIVVFEAPANEYHPDFKQWDITLAEGQDGVYKFTYTTYEDATQNVITWELVEKLDAGSAPVAACDIYFIGTFNEWSTSYEEGSEYHLYDNEDGTWEGTIIIDESMYGDWTLAEVGTLCAALKLYDAANEAWIGYNGDGNLCLTAGVYRIVYTVSTNSFTCEILEGGSIVEGGSGSGSTTGPITWYVRGTMNNWGAEADYKLVYDEEGNASITLSLMTGDTFKVADATWTEGNQFNSSHISGNPNFKEAAKDGNIEVVVGGTYTITVTAMGGFTIVGEGQEVPPVVEPTQTEWYVKGTMNSWSDNADYLLVYDENGSASVTVVFAVGDTFKVANSDWSLELHAGNLAANDHVVADEADTNSKKNMKVLTAGTYTVTVTADGALVVELVEATEPSEPVEPSEPADIEWYFAGSMNGWGEAAPLVYDENGVASIEMTLAVNDEFKIAAVKSGWEPQFNSSNIPADLADNFGDKGGNILVKVAGKYKFSVVDGALVIELLEAAEPSEPVEPSEPSEPAEGTLVYLVSNDNWNVDGARFAVYMWDDAGVSTWVDMVAVEGAENLYSAEIPAGYTNIIFCRMNPNAAENNWDNKWNQTSDLTLDGTNDCYTVEAGSWDNGNGTWSVYEAPAVEETPAE